MFFAAKDVLEIKGEELGLGKDIRGKTVSLEAYGKVGSYAGRIFRKNGCRIVRIKERTGIIYNENGINLDALDEHLKSGGNFSNFKGASQITEREFWTAPVDIFILAYKQHTVTEEIARLMKTKMIVEGANGPTTPSADRIFEERGILVVPDILANSGGVVVSYFEWLQNLEEERWTLTAIDKMLEERMYLATKAVFETAERYRVSLRNGALILALIRLANAELARNPKLAALFNDTKKPYKGYGEGVIVPDTIEELNHIIRKGRLRELIDHTENIKSREMDGIVESVLKKLPKDDTGVILITGPVTSGKLGFALNVSDRLNEKGRRAVRINFDEMTPPDLKRLLDDETVEAIDYVKKKKVTRKIKLKQGDIVVAEGNYTLSGEVLNLIPEGKRYGVFVNTAPSMKLSGNWPLTSLDLRLLRHILTMSHLEGRFAIDVIRDWPDERRVQIENVYPAWAKADVTFNGYLPYELPLIKFHVEKLIDEAWEIAVKESDEASKKIIGRLKRTLKGVVTGDGSDLVPPYSIIQQYLGGEEFYNRMSADAPARRPPQGKVARSGPSPRNTRDMAAAVQTEELKDMIKLIQAKEEKRPLIVSLGTSWIRGYERDGYGHYRYPQGVELNELITSIRNYYGSKKRISFIVGEDKNLPDLIGAELGKADMAGAKVVVLAGQADVKSDRFAALRGDTENVFVVGVDNRELTTDSYIRVAEMLNVALRLAFKDIFKEDAMPKNPNIGVKEDSEYHIYILIPHAKPMDYEKLKAIYEVQQFA